MVGIAQKVLSTQTQLSHKHHHHGGAICPSNGVVSMDLDVHFVLYSGSWLASFFGICGIPQITSYSAEHTLELNHSRARLSVLESDGIQNLAGIPGGKTLKGVTYNKRNKTHHIKGQQSNMIGSHTISDTRISSHNVSARQWQVWRLLTKVVAKFMSYDLQTSRLQTWNFKNCLNSRT